MLRRLGMFAILVCLSSAVTAQTAKPLTPEPFDPKAPEKPFTYVAHPLDVVTGKEDAPVVVVEYASLSCPHCAHFYTKVLPELTKKYIDTGKVKMVYRHFPLNPPALSGAMLVQCAEPERRHTFLKVLFSTQDKWAFESKYLEPLAGIAMLGGMDRKKFDACMLDKALEKSIVEVVKDASDTHKVTSTPTFFVNSTLEKGDLGLESMSASIDAALAAAALKTKAQNP